jgi:hypothetical protein
MTNNHLLLTIPFDGSTTLAFIVHQLSNHGLHVARSFELDSACASPTHGVCPHNGQFPCDCGLMVILVGIIGSETFPVILHSHGDETEIYLDEAERAARRKIGDRVIQALTL